MKQCPACRTTYRDASLRFCLEDGTPLIDLTEERQTVVRQGLVDPLRVDVSQKEDPTVARKREAEARSPATFVTIAVAAVLLIIAGIAPLGLAGAAYYYGSSTAKPDPTKTPLAIPSPSPSSDHEKERLKDEIANIQKRLDEKKKNANTDDDLHDDLVRATVNSPNDGFLALRTEPDADRGTRLDKIPHGHSVDVLNCEKQFISIAGRSGRWCLVEYSGQTGWVFDGFLEY